MLNHDRAKNTRIFKIKGQNQLVAAMQNLGNTLLDNQLTRGLRDFLELFQGATVMLRTNINITKGLVIGAIGFVTESIWLLFGRNQMYTTDVQSVRNNFSEDGEYVIKPIAVPFPV